MQALVFDITLKGDISDRYLFYMNDKCVLAYGKTNACLSISNRKKSLAQDISIL